MASTAQRGQQSVTGEAAGVSETSAARRVEVLEEWRVIDMWWRPDDEQIRRTFRDVRWGARRVVMMQESPDPVWRVACKGRQ